MPSEIMDQRSFCMSSTPTSFFSEEIHLPTERQVGFWKPDSAPDHLGIEGMSFMSGSKFVSSSSFGRPYPTGANCAEHLDLSLPSTFETQRTSIGSYGTKFCYEHRSLGKVNPTDISLATCWGAAEQSVGHHSDLRMQPSPVLLPENIVYKSGIHCLPSVRLLRNVTPFRQSVDNITSKNVESEPFESLEEIEAQTIGNLLPNDDELLSGLIDDLECSTQLNNGDDADEDLFHSGGGIELEADDNSNFDKSVGLSSEMPCKGGSNSSFTGEHPCGEHPSRTLFVRNINNNVEDTELRALFEQYGDIRTLYTACKSRGFVMISYYDIRAAHDAMRDLQNKPLRSCKLDIHFSIPKDNPSEKDINQGTLVFNLDSSASNDDLHQKFGVYGDIKEIRGTLHKDHRKFIEYYDVRSAEAALHALNRSDIAGKKIQLEPSHSGARCVVNQLSPELELDGSAECWPGSPPSSNPLAGIVSNGVDGAAIQGLHPSTQAPINPFVESTSYGVSSSVPSNLSSAIRLASLDKQNNHSVHIEPRNSLGHMNLGFQCMPQFYPNSLPEIHDNISNVANTMSPIGFDINSRPTEESDHRHIHGVSSGVPNGHSFEDGVLGAIGNGNCSLHNRHYLLNNSSSYHHHPHGPMMWSTSASLVNNIPIHAQPQMHGLARSPSHMLNSLVNFQHHAGSAPVNPSYWDRRLVFLADSPEAHGIHPGSLGSMGFPGSPQLHRLELASHNIFSHAAGNCIDSQLSSLAGIPSPQQRGSLFHGRNPIIPMPTSFDITSDRIRSRRGDACLNQSDNKKQYDLDIDRIVRGEDSRTTLMIKNIPNKYTSKMLLVTIDEHHRGTYNFIYLPIDFKNKCNVGYAFINMIDSQQIIPFYQAFNGKKWEKFNSEKVASLAYARIQGKAALIAHFQNSSLMNEDKRCRPILFHTNGPNAGDQEPFPVGPNVRSRPGRPKPSNHEYNYHCSPPSSANAVESLNGNESFP